MEQWISRGDHVRQTLVGLRKSQTRKLDTEAHNKGISRSELLRRIVDEHFKRVEGKNG